MNTKKRVFDLLFSLVVFSVMLVPLLLIALVVGVSTKAPILYWSNRVGKNNIIFRMPKFRTMRVDAPIVATHLMKNPDVYFTSVGRALRKTSLDELPQLWSILIGDMSIVGPRPALYNQDDLIALRTEQGVNKLVPGLTGWAQINGRDELPISEKVRLDVEYLQCRSFWMDIRIIWRTLIKVVRRHDVAH